MQPHKRYRGYRLRYAGNTGRFADGFGGHLNTEADSVLSFRLDAAERDQRGEKQPEKRRQRIERIKDEIRRGVYETEEKLSTAIDRLIDDVLRRRK